MSLVPWLRPASRRPTRLPAPGRAKAKCSADGFPEHRWFWGQKHSLGSIRGEGEEEGGKGRERERERGKGVRGRERETHTHTGGERERERGI